MKEVVHPEVLGTVAAICFYHLKYIWGYVIFAFGKVKYSSFNYKF